MNGKLDLHVIPVFRSAGQDYSELPGMYACQSPRRTARSRSGDQLILLMSLMGNQSSVKESQDEMLKELAKSFYTISGSVTSALKIVAGMLNDYLLAINHHSGETQPVVASLAQVVNRSGQLYIAQSGPVHAYSITQTDVEHFYNPELSGKGLGIAQKVPIRLSHKQLSVDDTFVLSDQHYPGWEKDVLSGLYGQSPESMRRRILPRNQWEMRAILIQAKPGKGKIYVLSLQVSEPEKAQKSQTQVAEDTPLMPAKDIPGQLIQPDSSAVSSTAPPAVRKQGDVPAAPGQAADVTPGIGSSRVQGQKVAQASTDQQGVVTDQVSIAEPETTQVDDKSPILRFFAYVFRPIAAIFRGINSLFESILPREAIAAIPNTTMAIIALLVPILVVSVSVFVYIQRGVSAQSQLVFNQAMELAVIAQSESEPLAKRVAWANLLDYLDTTEILYSVPQGQELRQVAQRSLDELDMVKRTEFQPAIYGGLPESTEINRIINIEDDLYLLDANSGSVLHAQLTDQGYLLDETFRCGPGISGLGEPIVDILSWPVGFEPVASLIGLSSNGIVVYCSPGEEPTTVALAKPDTSSLVDLSGFVMGQSNLYVLDRDANAVWIYWNSEVEEPPTSYFGDQIPDLDDIQDLMVVNSDLYLLHDDGHLTICQYGSLDISPTRCTDPVPYIDSRPGRENALLIPESVFTQILYNPPPDPSLYLLQSDSQSIYHFSLRSPTFQSEYKPLSLATDQAATAFSVVPIDRIFFLAIGNDVYYGRIP